MLETIPITSESIDIFDHRTIPFRDKDLGTRPHCKKACRSFVPSERDEYRFDIVRLFNIVQPEALDGVR